MRVSVVAEKVWDWDLDCFITQTSEDRDPAKETEGYLVSEKGILPHSFYEAKITLKPKPDKDTTRNENYRSISLMNTGTESFNIVSAN